MNFEISSNCCWTLCATEALTEVVNPPAAVLNVRGCGVLPRHEGECVVIIVAAKVIIWSKYSVIHLIWRCYNSPPYPLEIVVERTAIVTIFGRAHEEGVHVLSGHSIAHKLGGVGSCSFHESFFLTLCIALEYIKVHKSTTYPCAESCLQCCKFPRFLCTSYCT